jgi:predicted nucleic acid-binding protein
VIIRRDAWNMQRCEIGEILSFDTAFDAVPGIRRRA